MTLQARILYIPLNELIGVEQDPDPKVETEHAFAARAERSSPDRALEILSQAGQNSLVELDDGLLADLAS